MGCVSCRSSSNGDEPVTGARRKIIALSARADDGYGSLLAP